MISIAVKRINRQMTIYTGLQVFFIALLLFMAYQFQQQFVAKGMPNIFLNSILTTLVLQGILLYPIYRFCASEAQRELDEQVESDPEKKKALRQRRVYSDFMKVVIFIFYLTFIYLAPPVTFALSTIFFSFVATVLTYLQSFNFHARRLLAAVKQQ